MVKQIEPLFPSKKYIDPDADEIANTILDNNLALFVQQHKVNNEPYVPSFLIEYHFTVSPKRARQAKQLIETHLTEEELLDAAESEASFPTN